MRDPASTSRFMLVPRTVWLMARHGELIDSIRELVRRVYSVDRQYVLRRDLSVEFETPEARIPFSLRALEEGDIPTIVKERPRRLPVLKANIPTCYVAVTEDDRICYMQWLLSGVKKTPAN